MKYFIYTLVLLVSFVVNGQNNTSEEQVIDRYLKQGAWKVSYSSPEYQLYLDSAIVANPNMAYLYQQKAMPYFKNGKCEYGLKILDKAVELDPKAWIDYRAFIKCIFARTYADAIEDFEASKKIKGEDGFVMDHTYNFYIGLCYLQLNDLTRALEYLQKSIAYTNATKGKDWVHPLDLFYTGIALQELKKHEEAIRYFDLAIKNYAAFSDAKYYKSISLYKTGQSELAAKTLLECDIDFKKGYTINDDNVIYERYPYQLRQFDIDGLKKKRK